MLSSAGDQVAQVTIGFVVYAKTGSPFLAGLAYALTYLPSVVGGPALAGLAHAFPRQQLMITLDLARAGLVALMALPGMPIPGLAALFFATMLLGSPFAAARVPLLADVLPPAMRPAGSAIGNQTAQLGQITGLLAGGGLVAALGPYRALALDSLSFSLSAGILACWVRPRPAPPAPPRRPPATRPASRSASRPARSPGQAWPPSSAPRSCASWCCSAGWPGSPWCPKDWPRRTLARWAAERRPSACCWPPPRPAC